MILKAKARWVGGHNYTTLISLMDFSIDAEKRIVFVILSHVVSSIFFHLWWKTKPNHTDECRAVLPLEEK